MIAGRPRRELASESVPFEVLEVLGEGAFGAVCVARMIGDPLGRQVAIKVLKLEYASNPKVLHRTRDEARLLSRLHHPNIVQVERLIEVEGRPVLVMELVRGLDLKSLLRRSPYGVPAAVAMEVVRLTCVALDVAYGQALGDDGKPMRVIHRDIKPSNMLLSIHGAAQGGRLRHRHRAVLTVARRAPTVRGDGIAGRTWPPSASTARTRDTPGGRHLQRWACRCTSCSPAT